MTQNNTLDLRYMKTMAAGDPETMQALLVSLRKELTQNRTKARQLYQSGSWVELERFCHHFKSTLAFSGNSQLINANLRLWDLAKQEGGSASEAGSILQQLELGSQKVLRELNRLIK